MSIRVAPDPHQPSAAIEIALEKPVPDYGLTEVQHPTPRDVDALLMSQGFRDLVDDARGVLMELIASNVRPHQLSHCRELDLRQSHHFYITQLTGTICPAEDGVYRPGLGIVLRDPKAPQGSPLNEVSLEYVHAIAHELGKRMGLM